MNGRFLALLLAGAVCFAIPARADVVSKHKSTFEMGQVMSMEMNGTDYVKSDKSCSQVTSKMTGGMATMFGKGKPQETVNITRLDKGLIWELEPEKKRYSEKSLESIKKDMEEYQGEGEADDEGDEGEDEYDWTVEVKELGSRNINGFDCSGILGTATGVKRSDKSDSMFINYEQWNAQNVPGADEMEAYSKNYSNAIGVDEMWANKSMGEMLKQYGGQFQELGGRMAEKGGYPIQTIITVESPARPEMEGEEESEDAGSMSGMMGQMGKMFGKKDKTKGETEKGGRTKTFSMTHEILSIDIKGVSDSQFDIPEGYKKK